MARAIGRLTALKVEKAKEPGMYADGGGLYLRVTPEGARNWVLRFMLDRRPRWMGLGLVGVVWPSGSPREGTGRAPQAP
jgi:hypothetical protein